MSTTETTPRPRKPCNCTKSQCLKLWVQLCVIVLTGNLHTPFTHTQQSQRLCLQILRSVSALQVLRLLCQRRVLQQLQLQQLLQQPGARNGTSQSHQDVSWPEPRGFQAKDRQRQRGRVGSAAQQRLQLQAVGLPEKLLRVLRGECTGAAPQVVSSP